jgi:hypothetical protein
LGKLLGALAAVTEYATVSIDNMLQRESPILSWAATIVLVSAFVTDEMMVALARLSEAGRRVVLLALGEEPPPRPAGLMARSLLVYHLPSSTPAFQSGRRAAATLTEAALAGIPTPEPVTLTPEEAA